MAPSATSEVVVPEMKVGVAKQPEKHVHGAEDKTPLEAISHGPLVHPGESPFSFLFCCMENLGIKSQCGKTVAIVVQLVILVMSSDNTLNLDEYVS